MLRYKGVLHMKGTNRKVIFQGVHQLMGSDLGPEWAAGRKRQSKMVFIGIDLPQDILRQGLDQMPGLGGTSLKSVVQIRGKPTKLVRYVQLFGLSRV